MKKAAEKATAKKSRPQPYVSLLVLIAVLVIFLFVMVQYVIPRFTSKVSSETYCAKDGDCACGRHINTGECFTGNKAFVDVTNPCPDFCSGIAVMFETRCVDHECRQVRI